MMYQLIRSFAYENFGSDYHVAPQGHNKAIQPLALIAKENLSCWRRATRRPKKIVLEGLEAYLTNDESVRLNVIPMIESCLEKDEVLAVRNGVSATTTRKIDVEMGEGISGHADRNIVLGELNLSSVQEEYYKDMSLRSILSNAKLDPAKMEPYEKNKLYIITGVVYSEKMEIDGKREEKDELGAQLRLPRWNWISKLARLKADMSRSQHPAPPIERNERSPLLFTFAKVKYNQDNRCMELQQLVGAKMKRKGTLDVVADSVADSLCIVDEIEIMVTKEQWIYEDLMELSENKTETKLRVILSFLEETETLQEMILRARNYKNLVDRITKTNIMAIQIESPLSAKDLDLLQATGVEIKYHTLNNSKTLRISAHNRSMVQDFAQIFYHLQGVQDDEWRLLKEFCGNPIEVEDGTYSGKNDNGDDEGREEKEAKKCNDIIKSGGIIKEDMSTEEHTNNGDKRWNGNTDEREEDIFKDKLLTKEDMRNEVAVEVKNEEKEDIEQEKRLSRKGSSKEVKTAENINTDEKERDIYKEKQLAREEITNEAKERNKGNGNSGKENEKLINEEQEDE